MASMADLSFEDNHNQSGKMFYRKRFIGVRRWKKHDGYDDGNGNEIKIYKRMAPLEVLNEQLKNLGWD